MTVVEIETPRGLARAHVAPVTGAVGALVMGHGAGGGVEAKDMVAAAEVADRLNMSVAMVEQPYRVAGRKAPAPATHLDDAWLAVVSALRAGTLGDVPLVAGGRSMGARVACRTADAAGAAAVLCLAFPERPPGRKGKPRTPSRQAELDAVAVPTLVVQGTSDPFGMPRPGANCEVVGVAGNHSLTTDLDAVTAAIEAWLPRVLGRP